MGLHEVIMNATKELINTANIELSSEELSRLPQETQINIRLHNLELSTYLNSLNIQSLIELMSKTKYLDKGEYQTVLFTQLINNKTMIEAFAANGEAIKNSIALINSNNTDESIADTTNSESSNNIIEINDSNNLQ